MRTVLDACTVANDPELVERVIDRLGDDRAFLRSSYPCFESWFCTKVLPGLVTGERTLVAEERHGTVVGFLIVKHTASEQKLCTLRIRPEFENRGLGVRLFEKAFELLGTEDPLLSVANTTLPQFERMFRHFRFAEHARYRNRYRPGSEEVSFNGLLDPRFSTVSDQSCPVVPNNHLFPLVTCASQFVASMFLDARQLIPPMRSAIAQTPRRD